jgi:hypothetical protein
VVEAAETSSIPTGYTPVVVAAAQVEWAQTSAPTAAQRMAVQVDRESPTALPEMRNVMPAEVAADTQT